MNEPVWQWQESQSLADQPENDLKDLFRSCFSTPAGNAVLDHLQKRFLSRRVSPKASDAELRHTEGERSAIAYITRLALEDYYS